MKARPIFALLALCLGVGLAHAQSEIVTLLTTNSEPSRVLVVQAGQVAQLLSLPIRNGNLTGSIRVTRGGQPLFDFETAPGDHGQPFTMAGPVELQLRPFVATAFATFRLSPASEMSPPGNTIVIPADTKGANIIMEKSTDLSNWTAAEPGVYTNVSPSHLFFRLRAERFHD